MIPECMRHLPVHRGLPVPYVAIWSTEMVGPAIDWTPKGIVPAARPEYLRFSRGLWWLDTPDKRGKFGGQPVFGGTHSTRQRNCMEQGRCQVCGRRCRRDKLLYVVPFTEDGTQFLLHDEHDMIVNPPVCPACYEGALRLCPHLIRYGKDARVYRGDARMTGVHGTLVHPGNVTDLVYMPLSNPSVKFVMGRQLLVSLDNEVQVA